MGCAIILALLALAPRSTVAQASPFDRPEAPDIVMTFGGASARVLEQDFRSDLRVLGAFAGKQRLDRFEHRSPERATPWTLYGRLGPMHFQNQFQYGSNAQLSFRRQGPSLGGRVYFGLYKTFD